MRHLCVHNWCATSVSTIGAPHLCPQLVRHLCVHKWCATFVSTIGAPPLFPQVVRHVCVHNWRATSVSTIGAPPLCPQLVSCVKFRATFLRKTRAKNLREEFVAKIRWEFQGDPNRTPIRVLLGNSLGQNLVQSSCAKLLRYILAQNWAKFARKISLLLRNFILFHLMWRARTSLIRVCACPSVHVQIFAC